MGKPPPSANCKRLLACALPLLLGTAWQPAAWSADPAEEEDEKGWQYLEYVDKQHRWMSRQLGDMSRQIDGIFATEDLFDEVSGTYGEIRVRHRFSELQDNELDVDFRLKLRVPYTKDRLKLLIESDSDERESESAEIGSVSDRVLGEVNTGDDSRDERGGISNIFAGLRQEIINRSGLKIDLDAGIKVDLPPNPFVRGKLRRQWSWERWSIRFKEAPYWFTDDGFGHKTDLDIDRRLSKNWASRLGTRYKWEEDDEIHRLVTSLSFYRLSKTRTSLNLSASTFWDNDEQGFGIRGYTAATRVRHRLYKQWLFVEAIPHVVWTRQNNFEPSLAFSLGIEILFGEKYLKNVQEELLSPDEGKARGGVLVQRDDGPNHGLPAQLQKAQVGVNYYGEKNSPPFVFLNR